MPRVVVAGHLYRPGEGFAPGWVAHDGRRVLEQGEGKPPEEPVAHGLVLPSPVNAHTHVGDAVARGIDVRGRTLAEVVAPPDGLKHRILRETPEPERLEAMRRALREQLAHGARTFLDFREQGEAGARLLRTASEGLAVRPVILGRPAGAWDDEEAARVLQLADGFGLSALPDVGSDVPERMAALAHRHGKRFALHLSESRREDTARALDLRPDFVVHLVHATPDDLHALAAQRVPVVLCPRSNALFGDLPDARAMLDAGLTLALGSDNAMFHPLDPLADARLLARHDPRLPPAALLDALVAGGRIAARSPLPPDPFERDAPADLVVFEHDPHARGARDPFDVLLGGDAPPRLVHRSWEVSP